MHSLGYVSHNRRKKRMSGWQKAYAARGAEAERTEAKKSANAELSVDLRGGRNGHVDDTSVCGSSIFSASLQPTAMVLTRIMSGS